MHKLFTVVNELTSSLNRYILLIPFLLKDTVDFFVHKNYIYARINNNNPPPLKKKLKKNPPPLKSAMVLTTFKTFRSV